MDDFNCSGFIAKDRLKYLILRDRVSCTNETLDLIKSDIVKTISNYIDIDKNNSSISLESKTVKNKTISYINIKVPIKE